MRTKRQAFHKQIRKNQLNNIFRHKRFQILQQQQQRDKNRNQNFIQNLSGQNFEFQTNPQQRQQNNINIHQQQQQIELLASQLKDSITNGNFERQLQLIKDTYHKFKQMIVKVRSSESQDDSNQNHENQFEIQAIQIKQKKHKNQTYNYNVLNKIISLFFAYKLDELVSLSVKQSRYSITSSFSILKKQIAKISVRFFFLIFKQIQLNYEDLSRYIIYEAIFICMDQLASDEKNLLKLFELIYNMIEKVPSVREDIYFYNTNSKYISFNNLLSVLYQNKQRIQSKQFHQIRIFFILIFQGYLAELDNLQNYMINKAKFMEERKSSQNKKFKEQIKLEQILDQLQYPDVVNLRKMTLKQTKIFAKEIIKLTTQQLLEQWPQSVENQQDLADCIRTIRLMYEYFEEFQLKQVLAQSGPFISLIPMKSIPINLKNEILIYLDMLIYLDQKNIVTKNLLEHNNLLQVVLSFNNPDMYSVKLNILSNLLLSEIGKSYILTRINQIILQVDNNYKIPIKSLLTFISNYFFTQNYVHNSPTDESILKLLYRINRQFYRERQVEMEVKLFGHLYHEGWSQKLPDEYYQWDQRNKFNSLISKIIGDVDELFSSAIMEQQ